MYVVYEKAVSAVKDQRSCKCRNLIKKPLVLYRAPDRDPIPRIQNKGFLNQVPTLYRTTSKSAGFG